MKLSQLDLNKLHTFLAIAEHGGVTAAARELALTPSAVSQSLAALEDSLDVQLFDRVGRRLVATREGRILQARFRDVRTSLQQMIDEITDEDVEVRGRVRVGLFLGFPRAPLARFLADFASRHPRASVKLVYASRDELDEALAGGSVDFGFAFDRGASPRVEATRLFEQELVLVSGRSHFRRRLDLDALATTPVVDYYQSEPLIHRWIAHHFRRKAPPLDVRAWAATTNLVLDLVLEQVGVGVLPHYLVRAHLSRKRLFAVRTGRRELRDHIWLKERAGAYRGPALEAFRAEALAAFSSL